MQMPSFMPEALPHTGLGAKSTAFHTRTSPYRKNGFMNMKEKVMSQNNRIYDHLKKAGSISFLEAWTLYSVRSLPRRIADLREQGIEIISEQRKDLTGQRYVRYSLA